MPSNASHYITVLVKSNFSAKNRICGQKLNFSSKMETFTKMELLLIKIFG